MSLAPRRILLCVTGSTPQIVTEAFQALHESGFTPNEIHLITTAHGQREADATLLGAGWLAAVCAECGVDPATVKYGSDTLHLIRDGRRVLDDVRDERDNIVAGDTILTTVRELTRDAETAAAALLAGGRRTMTHYLGMAMSLLGRRQDRLFHVLIDPPQLEFRPDFHFVRRREPVDYVLGGGRTVHSTDVKLTLAEVPLLMLRDALSPELLDGFADYGRSVELIRRSLADDPELVFEVVERTVYCSGQPVRLSPDQYAFYLWMAERERGERRRAGGLWAQDISHGERDRFLDLLALVSADSDEQRERLRREGIRHNESQGGSSAYLRTVQSLRDGMEAKHFNNRQTSLNKALSKTLGARLSADFHVQEVERFRPRNGGSKPHSLYGLAVPAERIRIRWPEGFGA